MALYYRPLQPTDYGELKAIHLQLFPIEYEDIFFQKAVHSNDRVFSYAAICGQTGKMVGFVTARIVYMHECDPLDRHYLGTSSRLHDAEAAAYILTLGVTNAWRKCGIATALLSLVYQHAANMRCRMVFLHVIAYNEGGMRLYARNNFQCVARLQNFYCLPAQAPGSRDVAMPQPDLVPPEPGQRQWDAYIYMMAIGQEAGDGVDSSRVGHPAPMSAPSPVLPARPPWVQQMNTPPSTPMAGIEMPSSSVRMGDPWSQTRTTSVGRARTAMQQQQQYAQQQYLQQQQQQQQLPRPHQPSLFESWINHHPQHRQ